MTRVPAFASASRFSQRVQRNGFHVNQAVSTAVAALDASVASDRVVVLSSAARIVDLFDEPKPSKDLVLEALSAAFGYMDWNTLSGVLKRQVTAQSGITGKDAKRA